MKGHYPVMIGKSMTFTDYVLVPVPCTGTGMQCMYVCTNADHCANTSTSAIYCIGFAKNLQGRF